LFGKIGKIRKIEIEGGIAKITYSTPMEAENALNCNLSEIFRNFHSGNQRNN
jgi:hypothetical protein